MPVIKMPDGKSVRFPDDMPAEEIRALIVKKFPELEQDSGTVEIGPSANAAAAGAEQQPAGKPQGPAAAPAEEDNPALSMLGNTAAFLNNLGDTASFGIAPAIQRTVMNAFNPGSGDQLQADIDFTNEQNPVGSTAGFIAGIPVGAMAMGPAAAVIGNTSRIGNAFVQGGGKIGNALRLSGVGATTGAVEAATHGEDIGTGAAIGGVLGPAAGLVAKPVIEAAKRLAPGAQSASRRAWDYLARKLGEDPATLARHVDDYRAANGGRDPSVAQIVSDHDAGVIAQLGSMLPHTGERLRAGARAAETGAAVTGTAATLPNAPTFLAAVQPENVTMTTLLNARDEAMDTAMKPLRATPISIPTPLLDDINRAGVISTRKFAELQARVSQGTATLGDFDIVRRRLNKLNATGERSPDIEDVLTDLNTEISKQVPQYTAMLDDYAKASRYIDAFKLGRAGTPRGSITDAGERATMRSAEGAEGYAMGERLRTGAERARSSAPGSLRPADDAAGGPQLATAVTDVVIGAPISGARQAMQGLSRTLNGLNLSPAAQQEIGDLLTSTNPASVRRALANLRRAGADERAVRLAQIVASAALAEKGTSAMMQTGSKEDMQAALREAHNG